MKKQTSSSILMVRPVSFGFNRETATNNAFQGTLDLSPDIIQQEAVHEFDGFVAKLRSEGVDVLVVEDTKQPVKPDAVFPNNWFCTLHDGSVHLFPMYAPVRRKERRTEILALLEQKFDIKEITDWSAAELQNQTLEGTGSIIFDHAHRLAFACLSPRTDAALLKEFCLKIGYSPIQFTSEDENGVLIYHTNVMLHIGTHYAVVCLESIRSRLERENVTQQLISAGKEIIDISLEQVRHYAGNMLQVGNEQGELLTVMSRQALACLSNSQRAIIESSSRIIPMDITVIETIGGGSARCMMAEIFLDKKVLY